MRALVISAVDTFDVPAIRSWNRMGTSVTGTPAFKHRYSSSMRKAYPSETIRSRSMRSITRRG